MLMTHDERATDVEVPSEDGTRLKGRWWRCRNPRALLVIAHGFGEHGGSYAHVADELIGAHSVDVLAVDFRGHGRSPGRRGVIRRYDLFIDDLRSVINWASRQEKGLPLFLLGHSNGGQVSLRLMIEGVRQVRGLIVSNPAIRIHLEVPKAKILVGKVLRAVAPWVTLSSGSPTSDLTRDARMRISLENDPLRHNRINPPFYFGMVEGEKYLLVNAGRLNVPLLMLLGGNDPVIDPSTSREFFGKVASRDKSLLIYPDMLHEPLNEIGRDRVVLDVVRWIEQRIDGDSRSAS